MPKARLGVALLVPPPLAAEVDGIRRALGDGGLGRIPPHVTLVPPVNVRDDRLADALVALRSAAAGSRPLRLTLGPVDTFLPVNPVVLLRVGGEGAEALRAVRDAVFVEPLARPLTWPWVPHVTLADGAEPARIEAAVTALAGYQVEVVLDRLHLLQEGPGRVWTVIADAPFVPPAVVGRGGLPLELAITDRLDPEALALAAGPGRPLAVTARRDGLVVGTAAGATGLNGGARTPSGDDAGGEAVLAWLLVHRDERGQGIGAALVAAWASAAADRGCGSVSFPDHGPGGAGGELASFLRRLGWADVAGGLRRNLG